MFESAELGHKIDKATYASESPKLREALLAAQLEVKEKASFPILVIIGGVDGAGKGETINLLHTWMDPRHIATHAVAGPTDEESERPRFFRFWRALPPKGTMGVFFGSWYTEPIIDRTYKRISAADLEESLEQIARFERMLTDEGALIVKLWLHLGKAQQKKRLKQLAKDPQTAWRVTDEDWDRFEHYDRFRQVSAHALRRTSTAEAPWLIVEGADERYRSLTVGRALLDAMRARLAVDSGERPRIVAVDPGPPATRALDGLDVLDRVQPDPPLEKVEYEERLLGLQARLNLLSRKRRFQKHGSVLAFEGMDAAGKGGAIRRVTEALDARVYRVIPIAAPTEEERAQPYLWRFWRHVPHHGQLTIFDRTWYGRVLVERVEGFAQTPDWQRAYSEINDFEEQLVRHGTRLCKIWLHVTPEEQLRRFEERQRVAYKNFKITPDDWRNRNKWEAYMQAACDMIERTSTDSAPWTLIHADDKQAARLRVLEALVARLED